MCRDAPTRVIALNFGMLGDITDIIARFKFYVNRLRGFGVLTSPILPFFIGLAGRPYNFQTKCDIVSLNRVVITASQFILTTSRYLQATAFMFSTKTLELHYKLAATLRWFTAGGAIRIVLRQLSQTWKLRHYDVIDDVITRKL